MFRVHLFPCFLCAVMSFWKNKNDIKRCKPTMQLDLWSRRMTVCCAFRRRSLVTGEGTDPVSYPSRGKRFPIPDMMESGEWYCVRVIMVWRIMLIIID